MLLYPTIIQEGVIPLDPQKGSSLFGDFFCIVFVIRKR
ncbi:hypothetical protein PU02_0771 [Bartonella ancashensis]|uniref:Uncharacterized protein n=1 Tax=Bartonella ancashensis TaxID=1318743 RepID=A0A0M3T2Z4_9HYPH|nr:hypothetical protein PU02_0771 [Bartonella ancashensis]